MNVNSKSPNKQNYNAKGEKKNDTWKTYRREILSVNNYLYPAKMLVCPLTKNKSINSNIRNTLETVDQVIQYQEEQTVDQKQGGKGISITAQTNRKKRPLGYTWSDAGGTKEWKSAVGVEAVIVVEVDA